MKTRDEKFKSLVGYQIYPKSFKDTDGNGVGDINGIIEKLPYLNDLGIDFIWLNPVYQSPQVDGGYDISDFYAIDEMFGSLDDLKKLIEKAHEYNIKLIMDLVVNHTSDKHPWFIESKKSKDNLYHDYYHWVDASSEKMPNNWQSFFGGSAWTYDENLEQAYFHCFAKEQPDLNWKNPKMREDIYKMIRWWLDLGIDGFRLDAISHIQKENWDFEIKSPNGNDPWEPFMNVSGIEEYMSDIKTIFDEYGALTVGEASGVQSYQGPDWTNENGYINMIFELEHNCKIPDDPNNKIDIKGYKDTIIRWQTDMLESGWNALYIENHDNPRSIDTFGDGTIDSAKALAVQYMLLRGTPFIYQGQEIGIGNFPFTDINQIDVPDTHHFYNKLIEAGDTPEEAIKKAGLTSRDNSRTPMQWNDEKEAGFTEGKPWLAVNPSYLERNTEAMLADPASLTNLYKKLIDLRHNNEVIINGDVKFLNEKDENTIVYRRKLGDDKLLVIANLSPEKQELALEKNFKECKELDLGQKKQRKLTEKMILDPWEYRVYINEN
ncbi:glucohydrolase [Floricoccus penangensis]|uniref:Alpha-amylase n=1 Tax=Floricoccus penangensis TaxID=1859475 RepID=A0A9Q5JHS2_9LACT|nr:alpha-glucosidase [Floricoccus penangensis]OFI47567.1 glucohydrolase [Floricoccus penangensis]